MKGAIYKTARSTFGKKERPSQDWFNTHITKMEPLIEEKRKVFIAYKKCPNERTHAALKNARSNTQRIARQCANKYWQQLCEGIQRSAETGNIKGMYSGIKKALGPTVKGVAPLKSMLGEKITDRGQQMARWVEHYSELYSRETLVTEAALSSIKNLPIMEELDEVPTLEELSKAKQLTPSQMTKHQVVTASHLKLLNVGNQHCSNHCTNYFASAGRKEQSPKTCVMPQL